MTFAFAGKNADRREDKPCLYVGQTARTPEERLASDPRRLAARLEDAFRGVVANLLQAGAGVVNPPILGNLGPLGYRPSLESRDRLLPGLVQVAGHTPGGGVTARSLRAAGVYLVGASAAADCQPGATAAQPLRGDGDGSRPS